METVPGGSFVGHVIVTLVGFTLLVGIYLHGNFVQENRKREALLNEYEYLMADVWEENQDLKDQLGVFIMPKREKGGN